jgi:hypothetical protein
VIIHLEETLEHLLFHCSFKKSCLNKIGNKWPQIGDRLTGVKQAKVLWGKPMFIEIFIMASWNIRKERSNWFFKANILTQRHERLG